MNTSCTFVGYVILCTTAARFVLRTVKWVTYGLFWMDRWKNWPQTCCRQTWFQGSSRHKWKDNIKTGHSTGSRQYARAGWCEYGKGPYDSTQHGRTQWPAERLSTSEEHCTTNLVTSLAQWKDVEKQLCSIITEIQVFPLNHGDVVLVLRKGWSMTTWKCPTRHLGI